MTGDPSSIAVADAGLEQNPLVLKYQRILLEQLDELLLDGISDIQHIKLRLNEIYIERTLVPFDPFTTQQIAIEANSTKATLAELLRAPGSQIALISDLGTGKSICMRHVARACVAAAESDSAALVDFGHSWGRPLPLPILLTAQTIERTLHQRTTMSDTQHLALELRLWQVIETWFRDQELGALLPIVQHELEHGRCLLMID